MTYSEMKKVLSMIDSPSEKLEMVMDFGRQLLPVPNGAECNEILGCASHVELCQYNGRFYGVADSAIVRGIVAIIIAMIDAKSVAEIKNMDIWGEFTSLNLQLGTGRIGGVNSIISFLKNL